MKPKQKAKSLFEREMESPGFRKRFNEGYEAFQLEVQILNALEKKHWSYSSLAKAIGTSKSNISRDLKGGGLVTATFSRIRKIAEALGMKLVSVLIPQEEAVFVLPKIEELVRKSFEIVDPPKSAAQLPVLAINSVTGPNVNTSTMANYSQKFKYSGLLSVVTA